MRKESYCSLFLIGMGISFTVHDTSSNVIVVKISRLWEQNINKLHRIH